jgi:predicted nucleic acid-binding protein
MRIVFDTNILILSFLGDPATRIMQAALTDESLAFFYSSAMLDEYRNALEEASRERPVPFRPERVTALLAQIERLGSLVYPTMWNRVGS